MGLPWIHPKSFQVLFGACTEPLPSFSRASFGHFFGGGASLGLLGLSWASAEHSPSLVCASDGPVTSPKLLQASSRPLPSPSWASAKHLPSLSRWAFPGPPLGPSWASAKHLPSLSRRGFPGPPLGLSLAFAKHLPSLSRWAFPGPPLGPSQASHEARLGPPVPCPHTPRPLLGLAGPFRASLSLSRTAKAR